MTVEQAHVADGGEQLFLVVVDEAGAAVRHHLGDRAAAARQHRGAAGHRFDHHQAERLGPIDREDQRARVAQEGDFLLVVDLADELDSRAQERLDLLVEERLILRADLGRDHQPHAGPPRQPDRHVGPFFLRHAAEEHQVITAAGADAVGAERQPVMDGADPARVGQGSALRVADRDQRQIAVVAIELGQPADVETPVQSSHVGHGHSAQRRKSQDVDVGVDHVELARAAAHLLERGQVQRDRIVEPVAAEAQRAGHHRYQARACARVAAGEQGDVVAAPHPPLG